METPISKAIVDAVNKNAERYVGKYDTSASDDLLAMYITCQLSDITKIRFEKWTSVEFVDTEEGKANAGREGVINSNAQRLHNLVKKAVAVRSVKGLTNAEKKDKAITAIGLVYDTIAEVIESESEWVPRLWVLPESEHINLFGLDIVRDVLDFTLYKVMSNE